MTTRKRVKKLKQTNKRYSIKGWHTIEFLKNGTRLDFKIKNSTTEKCCGPETCLFPNLC